LKPAAARLRIAGTIGSAQALIAVGIVLLSFSISTAHAQRQLSGEYRTKWGAILHLKSDSSYSYQSFECYHLVRSQGGWSMSGDSLLLHFDWNWASGDSLLIGSTESFNGRPFLVRGRKLLFTNQGIPSKTKFFQRTKSLE
jgi:hypothetical protein